MGWKCVYNNEPATEVIKEISYDTYYKAKLLVVTSLQQRATLYEVSLNLLKLS